MLRSLKVLMLGSSLFTFLFAIADFNQLEAAYGRWNAYDHERGAWGGNGGWWGDNRSDWYGEYGTPQDNYYYNQGSANQFGYSQPYYRGDNYYQGDVYHQSNPYYGQRYDNGIGADAGVNGGGIYFNAH